jgi:hypothetical protein
MADSNGTITIIPAPEGYVVDFENPQMQYVVKSYIVVAVEMTLAFIFLVQRLYTKIAIMKKFQLEDSKSTADRWPKLLRSPHHIAIVVVAWIFCVGTQVCLLLGMTHGAIGRHAWEISIEKYGFYSRVTHPKYSPSVGHAISHNNQVILAAPLLYAFGTAAAKCSLALFYRRLNPNKVFQGFVWFTLFVTIGAYTAIFFSLLFACKPIAASWNPLLLGTAVCINRGAIYIAQAVIGIVTDVLLLGLPIPTVLKLQMPNKQKIGLVGIFGIGSMYVPVSYPCGHLLTDHSTIITSIVRLIILLPSLTTTDQTWVIGEGSLWMYDINFHSNLHCTI